MRRGLAPMVALLAALGLPTPLRAQAQSPRAQTPPSRVAPPPNALPPAAAPQTAAPDAFDALSEADRKATQEALIWTGDYQGVVDGALGRRSREAFLAWDRRRDAAADGLPTPQKLKTLFDAAARVRKSAGFAMVPDATGALIGVPKALTPQASRSPTASRFASKDGRVALDTALVDAAAMPLQTLFERLKTESPTRRVTYKMAKPDFVVVSGDGPDRKFYTRFAAGAGAQGRPVLRGFSFTWPSDRPELDRVAIAIAASFDPFPGAAPAAPEPAARPTPQPAPSQLQPVVQTPRPPAPSVSATALSLGAGRYLTALPPECAAATLAGAPARIVSRAADGVVVLEGPPRAAAALAPAAAAEGEAVALGFAAGEGGSSLFAVPGKAIAGALWAGLQPGMSGAPVFDREGRLLGLARPFASPRLVAGVAPAASHGLIPASSALAQAIGPLAAPVAPARTAADLAAAYRPALAPVQCGR